MLIEQNVKIEETGAPKLEADDTDKTRKHINMNALENIDPLSSSSSSSSSHVLLITANLGSLFEDPVGIQPIWTSQFQKLLERVHPEFVAIHCQEVQ